MTAWFRYEAVHYAAPADEWGESRGVGSVEVVLREYDVARRTPKGVWLRVGYHGAFQELDAHVRFVLAGARRRFACPTKAEAMTSFVARRRAEIRIYRARIERAERALRVAAATG